MKLSGRGQTEDPGAGTETGGGTDPVREKGAGAEEGAIGTEEIGVVEMTGIGATGSSRSLAGERFRSRILTAPGSTDDSQRVTNIMMLFTSLC